MLTRPTKILVVDDSAVVRQALRDLLARDPVVLAVESAPDGRSALRKVESFDPDVVTMDIEMPGLDGLETLRRLMTSSPRPVIMLSAFTFSGATRTIRALELGAVDFIQKPGGPDGPDITAVVQELLGKVRVLGGGGWRLRRSMLRSREATSATAPKPVVKAPARNDAPAVTTSIVAIGASTGGTEAIRQILQELPANLPAGLVITQHMPAGFTAAYAQRLNECCALEVKEASHHDFVRPGRVLIAPGNYHMTVRRVRDATFVEVATGQKVEGCRPSVDVLFKSAAAAFGSRTIAALLTGMGKDGAAGMRAISDAGGVTIAQDEESCVVFGMPRAAIDLGAVSHVKPLADIARLIQAYASRLASAGDPTKPGGAGTTRP